MPWHSEVDTPDWVGHRHPLQELVVDTFVPNDASLGVPQDEDAFGDENEPNKIEKSHRVLLCTGANACGKVRNTISAFKGIVFMVDRACI